MRECETHPSTALEPLALPVLWSPACDAARASPRAWRALGAQRPWRRGGDGGWEVWRGVAGRDAAATANAKAKGIAEVTRLALVSPSEDET